ncbi:hypothetical protein Tco_0713086 [Tanacetum coccineum]
MYVFITTSKPVNGEENQQAACVEWEKGNVRRTPQRISLTPQILKIVNLSLKNVLLLQIKKGKSLCYNAMYEFQMQYGSIGWSVGALLGYAQSIPEKGSLLASVGSFRYLRVTRFKPRPPGGEAGKTDPSSIHMGGVTNPPPTADDLINEPFYGPDVEPITDYQSNLHDMVCCLAKDALDTLPKKKDALDSKRLVFIEKLIFNRTHVLISEVEGVEMKEAPVFDDAKTCLIVCHDDSSPSLMSGGIVFDRI